MTTGSSQPDHACVAGSGGHIAGTVLHRFAVGLAQRPANICAIGAAESCFGNGHVVRNLAFKEFLYILRTEGISEIDDTLHGQDAPVRAPLGHCFAARAVDDARCAVQQLDKIGVAADNAGRGLIAVRADRNADVENER